MAPFRFLRIRSKLTLAFSILGSLVLLIAIQGIWFQRLESNTLSRYVSEFNVRQELAVQILNASNVRAVAARNIVLADRPANREAEKTQAVNAHKAVQAAHARLGDLLLKSGNFSPDEQALYARMKDIEGRYGPVALSIVDLGASGRRDEATRRMNDECRPLLAALVKSAGDYAQWAQNASQREVESLEATTTRGMYMLGGIAFLAGCAALWLAVAITRSITRPMLNALQVARRVAEGDLTSEIRSDSRDEAGQLLEALRDMNSRLAQIVAGVRQSSEHIGHGSSEIAAGSSDLSQRTERQASALEETAATMAQLGETVRLNAENARQADQLARGASEAATQGGQVVREVVEKMKGIHDSSRRIADIAAQRNRPSSSGRILPPRPLC